MAAYPTLPQTDGTKLVARSGVKTRIASNGTVRARAISSATRYDPILVHSLITLAQWNTLKTFYEANRGIVVTLTYVPETLTLSCVFADKPFDYKMNIGGSVTVTTYLMQSN